MQPIDTSCDGARCLHEGQIISSLQFQVQHFNFANKTRLFEIIYIQSVQRQVVPPATSSNSNIFENIFNAQVQLNDVSDDFADDEVENNEGKNVE